MKPSYQEIESSDGSNYLLIRLFGLRKLRANRIKEIVDLFKEQFSLLPIGFMKLIINVISLDQSVNSYVIYLKLNENTAIYSSAIGSSQGVVPSLKGFLGAFVEKLSNDIDGAIALASEADEDALAEAVEDNYNNPLGSVSDPVNVDEILKDFAQEEKRKKKEGQ